MIFITYYTPGDYEQVFKEKLLPSLIKWELPYEAVILEGNYNWQTATQYKATFLKKMLLKHKQSIVFIDVDATIEQYPILFDQLEEYDIGLHFLDWFLLWRKLEGNSKREGLGGTLYLNYNQKIFDFLDEWIKENERSNNLEQKNMQEILKKWEDKLKVKKLPAEYCTIIMRNGTIPTWYVKEIPIIVHYQASREFKNKRR